MASKHAYKYVSPGFIQAPFRAIAAGKSGQPESLDIGGVKAVGSIQFSANPTDGDSITLNGVAVSFGAAGDVAVGVDLATTLASLTAFLNASVDAGLAVATYTDNTTDTLTATYDTYAVAGNSYAIVVTALTAAPTANDATLLGGQDAVEVSLETENTIIAITQNVDQQFDLVDGDDFQKKVIACQALDGTGTAIVTPTNLTGGTTLTFDAVGEVAVLQFLAGSWSVISATAGVLA